jgi:hypothetical protein
MVMVYGGTSNVTPETLEVWKGRRDGELREWKQIYETTSSYYKHYRAVLEGDIHDIDFDRKQQEVAQTRNILQPGATHRDATARRKGLGPQDRNEHL